MPLSPLHNKTAIVGVGFTPIARHGDRSLTSFAVEAALDAIRDAGLTPQEIDGYVGCPNAPNASAAHADGVDEVSAGLVVRTLGIQDAGWVVDVNGLPTAAMVTAAQALHAGACSYVLIVRAMWNPQGTRYNQNRRTGAAGAEQFTLPYGLGSGGGPHALRLQRYLHENAATREELFEVVNAGRTHAQLNTVAYWKGRPLSLEDYMNARWIYEPLCLFDCDIPVTAAGALVMTTAERARDLPHKPAYIAGYASTHQPMSTIFETSGVDRKDVQVAQIYDGFAPFVWYWLEALGFCAPGEAHAFTRDGNIQLGGKLPVNTFGGNLGEGRLHGFGHVREGALQIMGRAGQRQVPNAEHCLLAVGQLTPGLTRYLVMLSAG